jgi:hypothetical protein
MRNLTGLQVIDSYAYVSELDTAPTTVLSTFDTRKLTGENGPIQSSWVKIIAQKCIGREMICMLPQMSSLSYLPQRNAINNYIFYRYFSHSMYVIATEFY